ncbi:hypothetical protein LSH36_334g06010 [Paralvinella palmiformis]|uniref:SOCS box domain-containing protein n=1 Tax=Paralvinella palmiformis TaxID=53620 RepID=A0AAD9JHH6_9ANNE|nr:hypothetical protein LSH36_334g06010 [Paralvinella palmiformis]
MIRQAVQLSGKSNVQLVTSSLLISDFLWQRNQLIIEVLGSVQHRDHKTGDMELIEHWDMSHFWMRSALNLERIVDRPQFGCVVSKDESEVIITGPAFNVFSSWGSRIMDLTKKCFIMDINIEGYKWIVAAAYHTKIGHKNQAALVCSDRFEFITNYARPNTTGTLLLFDTSTGDVITTMNNQHVSSEVLKFCQDGSYIIARLNDEQCLAVIDSAELIVLRTFPHSFLCFPYSYHTVYPMFPVVSNCGTKMAVLEWNKTSSEPDVYVFHLPCALLPLMNLTKIVILQSLHYPCEVNLLPLPSKLKHFIQCQQ